MIDYEKIIEKAWRRYFSKEEIADYTKYDALYDVTIGMDLSEKEYQSLMDKMEYL